MQSRDGSKSSRTSPTVSTTRNPSRRGDQPARPRHGGGFPMRSRRFRGARTCPLPARNVRENREQEISELVDRIGMAVNSELDLKRIFQGIARAVGIVARDRAFRDLQPGFRRQVRHRTGDRDPGPVARGRRHPRPCGSHERVGGGGPPFCPAHAGGGSRKPDCSAGGAWPQAGRLHPTGGQGAPPGRRNVAHAIPYARLYARHRRLASEARLLASTSRAATAGLDIRALAQRCLTMVRDRTPFDRATLREVVPEGVWLRVRPGLLPRAAPRVSRRALISRSGHRPRRICGCRRGTFLSRAKA